MAKVKKETKPEVKESKKGFVVVDRNGKTFRTVAKEDDAKTLAQIIGGKIK